MVFPLTEEQDHHVELRKTTGVVIMKMYRLGCKGDADWVKTFKHISNPMKKLPGFFGRRSQGMTCLKP